MRVYRLFPTARLSCKQVPDPSLERELVTVSLSGRCWVPALCDYLKVILVSVTKPSGVKLSVAWLRSAKALKAFCTDSVICCADR